MIELRTIVASIFMSLLCMSGPMNAQEAVKVDPPENSFHIFHGGHEGKRGHEGPDGDRGHRGHHGSVGAQGPIGPTGTTGAQGISGGVFGSANFFALMPGDNAAPIAANSAVNFPQDGSIVGTDISRLSPSTFNLATIGTYMVQFQVSVSEAGQLLLTLNGADLAYTVVGRATGTDQIVGMALVNTTTVNSVLDVRNPSGNATALTITPLAGGTQPVSANLTITRIN